MGNALDRSGSAAPRKAKRFLDHHGTDKHGEVDVLALKAVIKRNAKQSTYSYKHDKAIAFVGSESLKQMEEKDWLRKLVSLKLVREKLQERNLLPAEVRQETESFYTEANSVRV